MDRIRVVIAEMPRMLSDIVQRVLADQSDIVLTCMPLRAAALAEALQSFDPDVVILAEPTPDADAHAGLLYAHPKTRLVGISGDGRDAHLYELRPQRVALGALSPASLVDIVRAPHAGAPPRRGSD